ncbi:MAG: branched-chain amino acid ABC transporter permease [Chloroflexi bacterium]|nr:branched-chain amino acid ABC transporter permease [Chloroflexota bacterium]
MATKSVSQSPWMNVRTTMRQPVVAGALLVAYILAALLILSNLDRGSLWFPLYSTLAFPALVLSPFIILASPVRTPLKVILVALLLFVAIPYLGMRDSSYLELIIQICIFAGLALGLNIVVGFAGLLDLGYIAFFAVGAYTWAMFTSQANTVFNINGWLVSGAAFYGFIFLGVVVAAVVGILLGLPVLRLRGDYLAIVTLGFGEMIRVIANNLDKPINFTNGSQGLFDVGRPPVPPLLYNSVVGAEAMLGFPIANATPLSQQLLFYFIAIGIIALIIIVARRLDNSPIGRAWTAIREDEVAAIAMGVPLVRMKLMAFAMGASFAGAIGVLYGAKQTFVSPESFSLIQSISILAMVIVGGIGGIRGALFGAVIVTLLNLLVLKNLSLQINALRNVDFIVPIINFHIRDWPTQLEPAKYERLIFGLLLIVMMIFRPAGLLPEPRRKMELLEAKGEEPVTVTAENPVVTAQPDAGKA